MGWIGTALTLLFCPGFTLVQYFSMSPSVKGRGRLSQVTLHRGVFSNVLYKHKASCSEHWGTNVTCVSIVTTKYSRTPPLVLPVKERKKVDAFRRVRLNWLRISCSGSEFSSFATSISTAKLDWNRQRQRYRLAESSSVIQKQISRRMTSPCHPLHPRDTGLP